VKLCVDYETELNDSGYGEDYWTSDIFFRPMLGAYAAVVQNSNVLWEGYLGDGIGAGDYGEGCTPSITMSHDQSVSVQFYSHGYVNGNYLQVRDDSGGNYFTQSLVRAPPHAGGTTYTLQSTAVSPAATAYRAIVRGLWNGHGGKTGYTFKVRTSAGQSRYDRDNDTIYIKGSQSDRKFIALHEFGHAVGDMFNGGRMTNGDCSLDGGNWHSSCWSAPLSGGSHGMKSVEHDRCATYEGWAHFVSANTFNDYGEDDCFLRYWSNYTVDCEGTSGDVGVTAWMENVCYISGSMSRKGSELDWFRQFWDVRTDGSGYVELAEFWSLISDTRAWDDWDIDGSYYELNSSAQEGHQDAQMRTNWNARKSFNGIVH
jgi:hypothetical protein